MKFEPKWSLPLCDLSFSPPEDNPEGKKHVCSVKGRQRWSHLCVICMLAPRPVPVTSDMELSVMKNKIAELKAQLNKDAPRERSASSSGEKEQGFTFVSSLLPLTGTLYAYMYNIVCVNDPCRRGHSKVTSQSSRASRQRK